MINEYSNIHEPNEHNKPSESTPENPLLIDGVHGLPQELYFVRSLISEIRAKLPDDQKHINISLIGSRSIEKPLWISQKSLREFIARKKYVVSEEEFNDAVLKVHMFVFENKITPKRQYLLADTPDDYPDFLQDWIAEGIVGETLLSDFDILLHTSRTTEELGIRNSYTDKTSTGQIVDVYTYSTDKWKVTESSWRSPQDWVWR